MATKKKTSGTSKAWRADKRFVRDEGSLGAPAVLIGEAPGRTENDRGRPFIGMCGMRLVDWWGPLGLDRKDFYITNVVPYQPPANRIGAVPKPQLDEFIHDLHTRLAALRDPKIIVPTGDTALRALTGMRGITKYRGSILSYRDLNGRRVKVVPTFHPAYTLWDKRGLNARLCQYDWTRIAEEMTFRALRRPKYRHVIAPTEPFVRKWMNAAVRAKYMSVDIENVQRQITCVGFSIDPGMSLVFPFIRKGQRQRWRKWIQAILNLSTPKVLQNGQYDRWWLEDEGFDMRRFDDSWLWDLLELHHCHDSTLPHSLAFMASVDSRQPYWKDETKDADKLAAYVDDEEALLTYNGIDNCQQRFLAPKYVERVREAGLEPFYEKHYREMRGPFYRISRHGIRVDVERRKQLGDDYKVRRAELRHELEQLAGTNVFGPKGGLSPQKLKAFLYGKGKLALHLPTQYNRQTKKRTEDGGLPETTNEIALRRCAVYARDNEMKRAGRAVELILEERRCAKAQVYLQPKTIDKDGRYRTVLKFVTETGRCASSANPRRTGGNLQNIPHRYGTEIKETFLPDEGCLFIEADLSQAEDRIVKMLTRDPALRELACRHPADYDTHTDNAQRIFRAAGELDLDEVLTKDHPEFATMRHLGKTTVHAGNYEEGPETMSDGLMKHGYELTPEECRDLQLAYFDDIGKPVKVWQRSVREQVAREGIMVNPFGRRLDLRAYELNQKIYGRAYAFVPQSTVADIINQWGIKPLDAAIETAGHDLAGVRINMQIHDSILCSVRPEKVYWLMKFLRKTLERPLQYYGHEMTIPVTFKLGVNWGRGHEWKRFPARADVEAKVAELTRGITVREAA